MTINQVQQTFKVEMACEGCANAVRKALNSCPGIDKLEIDLGKQTVVVYGLVTNQCLSEALKATGKPFKLLSINASQ